MRPKILFFLSLLTVMFLSYVLKAPAHSFLDTKPSPSKFFSTFSLPDLLSKHKLQWQDLCSGRGSVGIGMSVEPSGAGSNKDPYRKSVGMMCGIGESVSEKFKEKDRELLEALKSDIEELIIKNGAMVIKRDDSSAGFSLEYGEIGILGKIKVESEVTQDDLSKSYYYSLKVKLVEERKDLSEPNFIHPAA